MYDKKKKGKNHMDYMDKLFAQHPFIYKISGKYYAFGNRVCAECKKDIPTLELRYDKYCKSFNEPVSQYEANDIFRKLKFAAEFVGNDEIPSENSKDEIKKFGFNDSEMKELKKQIDKYIEFWNKYRLQDFSWT